MYSTNDRITFFTSFSYDDDAMLLSCRNGFRYKVFAFNATVRSSTAVLF